MSGVSLFPMHNVGIYRTHWAIQKNYNGKESLNGNQKKEWKNKHIKSDKTSKKKAVWPIVTRWWPMKEGEDRL